MNGEFIIISGTVFSLLALWSVVGYRHLSFLMRDLLDQWEAVDEGLRKRHDIVPNLVETLRNFGGDKFVEDQLIVLRDAARREEGVSGKKVEVEHDLTASINAAFALKDKLDGLGQDTNFLELKKEILDLENNVDEKTNKYNEMVRFYNNHRKNLLLRPVAAVFKFGSINIFEFEM